MVPNTLAVFGGSSNQKTKDDAISVSYELLNFSHRTLKLT